MQLSNDDDEFKNSQLILITSIEVTLCRVYTSSLLTSHEVLYVDDLITKENFTHLENGPRITPLQVVTATHITLTHTPKAAVSNAQV